MRAGQVAESVAEATWIVYNTETAHQRAQAWLFILEGQIFQRDIDRLPNTIDQAGTAVSRCNDPRLDGRYHALAAWYHHHHGRSLDFTAQHLVLASRALRSMTEASQAAVDAWYDLAVVLSSCGYQQRAAQELDQCHALAERAGVRRSSVEGMAIRVRDALLQYYTGDPRSCIGQLREALQRVKPNLHDLDTREREWVHYAIARLSLLGFGDEWSVEHLLPEETSSVEAQDLRTMALASRLIAQKRGLEALEVLEAREIGDESLGVMEPKHLKSLALVAKGDHAESILAAHATTYALYKQINQFHSIYLDSAAAVVDQQQLRRAAADWADRANTDDLTGLPNRRRLDRFLSEVEGDGMIAVLDLDGFKAVNDTHGHQAGDAILQRVAALLSRVVRSGDLLARTGGDEFIVVLPGATEYDADAVSERIREAVAAERWEYSVPGTPVDVSVGWARLSAGGNPAQTLWAADQAMYQMKRSRKHPWDGAGLGAGLVRGVEVDAGDGAGEVLGAVVRAGFGPLGRVLGVVDGEDEFSGVADLAHLPQGLGAPVLVAGLVGVEVVEVLDAEAVDGVEVAGLGAQFGRVLREDQEVVSGVVARGDDEFGHLPREGVAGLAGDQGEVDLLVGVRHVEVDAVESGRDRLVEARAHRQFPPLRVPVPHEVLVGPLLPAVEGEARGGDRVVLGPVVLDRADREVGVDGRPRFPEAADLLGGPVVLAAVAGEVDDGMVEACMVEIGSGPQSRQTLLGVSGEQVQPRPRPFVGGPAVGGAPAE